MNIVRLLNTRNRLKIKHPLDSILEKWIYFIIGGDTLPFPKNHLHFRSEILQFTKTNRKNVIPDYYLTRWTDIVISILSAIAVECYLLFRLLSLRFLLTRIWNVHLLLFKIIICPPFQRECLWQRDRIILNISRLIV